MRKLQLPVRRCWLQKTGLPFFDANRLLGVAYYFFGNATAEVRDRGAVWELQGPLLRRSYEQVTWIADRLKNRGFERIEATTLNALEGFGETDLQQEFESYFAQFPHPTGVPQVTAGRYLEPGYLQGARGPDAFTYRHLASQKGIPYKLPRPEALAATIGLAFAGIAWGGRNDQWLILPVLAAHDDQTGAATSGGSAITLGPFYDFDHQFGHPAGGLVAAVGMALEMADQLGRRAPIRDLAYAHFGARGFYQSGTLGFERLLARGLGADDGFMAGAARFLRTTAGMDPNRYRPLVEMARTLAELIHHPTSGHFERLVRQKARALAHANELVSSNAARLMHSPITVREVCQLVDPNTTMPELQALTLRVAEALAAQGKGWIGWYTRLEGTQYPDRFAQEVERLLARRVFAAVKAESERSPGAAVDLYIPADEMADFKRVIADPTPAHFRAFKSTFLAMVLSRFTYQRRQKPKEGVSE